MGILGLANGANSIEKLVNGGKGFAPDWLSNGQNGTFSTVVGSATSFVIGTGRTTNIYSADIKTVHNLAEMARFLYNTNQPGLGGILFGFLTNKGGGDTAYVFGNKKSLTYRFTPNFTVDRFCNTQGFIGGGAADPQIVHNIEYKPLNNKNRYMVLPALFSTGLLAFDLVLAYKLKLTSYTPIKTGSGTPTGGYKAMSGAKTAATSDLMAVGLVLAGMKAFEAISLIVLRLLEKKFFCAVTLAKKEVDKCKEKVRNCTVALEAAAQGLSAAALGPNQAFLNANTLMNTADQDLETAKRALDDALSNFKSAFGATGLEI